MRLTEDKLMSTETHRRPRRGKPFPWHIVLFLVPALAVYTAFMIYPLIDSLRLSFLGGPQSELPGAFVGLQNYKTLLTDDQWEPRFWGALKNNLLFFAVHMLVQNPIGLLLASLLDTPRLRGRSVYRTLLFMPTMLSFVIVGFIWNLILSPLWGIAPNITKFLGIGYLPWLGRESSALPTLSLISVWQFVGIPMLLFLTALMAIPHELIEAARVDGANAWRIFWRIKFPLILPTVGIVGILTFIGNFNAFDLVYTLKGAQGAPNYATDLLGTLFYRSFFGVQLQVGNPAMGTTIAMMIFLIILFGTLIYLFFWQRKVVTYEL
jgi:raffinose/stachyose/melibiose transport system permease protein